MWFDFTANGIDHVRYVCSDTAHASKESEESVDRHMPEMVAQRPRVRAAFVSNIFSAQSTGVEPATSHVTGGCSNQLSYDCIAPYYT